MYFPVYYALDVGAGCLLAFAAGYRGISQGLPLAGALILATLAGLCGIIVRDVLLQFAPIAPLHDPVYAAAALGGALFGGLAGLGHLRRRSAVLPWCYFAADSLGLALATAMGVSRGEVVGISPVGCVLLGLLAGCLPGIMRDLCLGEVPQAFEKQFYAVAALLTAMAALALGHILLTGTLAVLGAALVGVFFRYRGQRKDCEF